MARPKRGKPFDPAERVYDRKATAYSIGVVVTTMEVACPIDGAKLEVVRQLRGDPLANLHARKHIDEAQYQGGRAYQHDFESAERGPRAIDPSKEFVDGGLMPEPITEAQRKAVVRLNQIQRSLGLHGSSLTYAVLIDGKGINEICAVRQLTTQREQEYIGQRFRECLDELAKFYGFAMNGGWLSIS